LGGGGPRVLWEAAAAQSFFNGEIPPNSQTQNQKLENDVILEVFNRQK
jgi:hypothetical protein